MPTTSGDQHSEQRKRVLPDETIAWAERAESWGEMQPFVKFASRRDIVRTGLGSLAYAMRQSGVVLAVLSALAVVLESLGASVSRPPQWAWVAGCASVMLVIGMDARRLSKVTKIHVLYLVPAGVASLLHVPWWLTWGLLTLVFLFFASTAFAGVLALLGRGRYDASGGAT